MMLYELDETECLVFFREKTTDRPKAQATTAGEPATMPAYDIAATRRKEIAAD